jgi:hypothetical protein
MPVFRKATSEITGRDPPPEEDTAGTIFFIARRNWFGLSSTEGTDYAPPPIPGFDETKMLTDPFTLQYVAGHDNIKTTMRYVHPQANAAPGVVHATGRT